MTWPEAAVTIAFIASTTWLLSLIIDRYEPRFSRNARDDDD